MIEFKDVYQIEEEKKQEKIEQSVLAGMIALSLFSISFSIGGIIGLIYCSL